jgi:hypothetical protein
VVLAAGEILESCAVAFPRQGANIHLQAFVIDSSAGLVLTPAEDLADFRICHEPLKNCRRSRSGDEQIHVADRFPFAPNAAGGGDLLDARQLREVFGDFERGLFGETEQKPAGATPVLLDRPKHLLLLLGIRGRVRSFCSRHQRLQHVHRGDLEMLEMKPPTSWKSRATIPLLVSDW